MTGLEVYKKYLSNINMGLGANGFEERELKGIYDLIDIGLYIEDIIYINIVLKAGTRENGDYIIQDVNCFLLDIVDAEYDMYLEKQGYSKNEIQTLKEASGVAQDVTLDLFGVEEKVNSIMESMKILSSSDDTSIDYLLDSEESNGREDEDYDIEDINEDKDEIDDLLSAFEDKNEEQEDEDKNEDKDVEEIAKEYTGDYRGEKNEELSIVEENKVAVEEVNKKKVKRKKKPLTDEEEMAKTLYNIYNAGGKLFNKIKTMKGTE